METDITQYTTLNPAYIAIEPISPNAEFKPDGSKYELHSLGKVIKKSSLIKQYLTATNDEKDMFYIALEPNIGDIIMYDGTKSISIVETSGKLEFVPINAILAIKEK